MLQLAFLPYVALLLSPYLAQHSFAAPVAASFSPAGSSLERRVTSATTPATTLSASGKNDIKKWAQFTEAAYCSTASINAWKCGEYCSANPATPLFAGGWSDVGAIPPFYVAYSPVEKAIVISHQGTTVTNFLSVLSDIVVGPADLLGFLFPGTASKGLQVHAGFASVQAATAPLILAQVKKAMKTYNIKKVVCVGHSLGAAIATLDALYLKLQIPELEVKARLFESPRVGNEAFANFFGQIVSDSLHITYKSDPVPRLPGRGLGFVHVPNELFINDAEQYLVLSGLENINGALSTGSIINPFRVLDHAGPVMGVSFGPDACKA